MIAVEGVDHVGKTTLVREIAAELHATDRTVYPPYPHCVQKWSQLPATFDYYHGYLRAVGWAEPVIMDRFCVSELAYGPVYRGHVDPRFDYHARRQVARALNTAGAVHVRVHAPWSEVKKRIERVPDELVKHEQHFQDLTREFDTSLNHDLALGRHGIEWLPTLTGHFGPRGGFNSGECGHLVGEYARKVVSTWTERRFRARLFRELDTESWGSLQPRVLLVGERVNTNPWPDNQGWGRMPFASRSPASLMLTRLLDAAGLPEGEVHVVNAYRVDGDRVRPEVMTFLKPEVVVPLGEKAAAVVAALGWEKRVRVNEFPHPQWLGRFRSKEFSQWGQRMQMALSSERQQEESK